MSPLEKLFNIVEEISDDNLIQLIKFAESLKEKESKETKALIEKLAKEYDYALKELAK